MTHYVAGLLYSEDGMAVALIQKNRPQWQAGLFNAIGGKVELGETAQQAMRREFREEAGVDLEWTHRMTLKGSDYSVDFFSRHDDAAISQIMTMTDEVVEIHQAYDLPENLIPNLWWIIPMMNDDYLAAQTIEMLD